ncbi:hypothetical protein QU630_24420 [Klebsiella pneumoniae]|uniref:hypothetical protein n=1 Tax=Klebsiella pneumoniae TaxID=573 RepID=UPI0025AB3F79|nr:hypothetical protein [Klebsiella pneumoniae]MDM9446800.1 hypothetical protein [Klebsiella pneumoniae]MDM9451996.1 hypothetical protein [Klebsiella pneumoniae]MDM9458008.1 hypothetical protein [Klebsiella pneumoniae]MDM9468987.1 hypothetical protein [Klebsiella pneumoniae]MDM9480240.1 hypothetical protein [Klebsiella pneumoniae]
MNAFNNLFNRHCQNTLLARGWPADMELNYSLAYCQGDGVAFYGVLHDKEILSLLAGLVKYNHITAKLAEEVAEVIKDSKQNSSLNATVLGTDILMQIPSESC